MGQGSNKDTYGIGDLVKKFTQKYTMYILLIFFFIVGCAGTKPKAPEEKSLPEYVPAQHLVFIGLDGWGGAYVSGANMPTVKRMMAGGASSLDGRSVIPSNSWPNWMAIFTGISPESLNPVSGEDQGFPSIFTLVKNNYPEKGSVFFYQWDELQKIPPEQTVEMRTIHSNHESAESIAAYIVENKPFFTAVAFNEPDSTGHSKRWGSKAYYDKLTELDGFIGIIEQAVRDAGVYDDTVFILASDHGGALWGHGFNLSSHRRIPLVIYGRNIREGFTIPSPLSICDIAPTMAAILGLEVPPEWKSRVLTEIFKQE